MHFVPVISVTEVNLARVPRALEGEVKGVGSQRARVPSFLPVNVLVNLIVANEMDPYYSDSSDGGPEFPSQSTIPEPPLGRNVGQR